MPEATPLRRFQERLREAIVASAPLGPDPEAVIRSTAKLSAAARLDLYRRGYRLRLLDAMGAFYPALAHLLGRELFDDFAWDYLRERPSRSYTLQRLADGFPDHLEAGRPDAGGEREAWPDMMIDLARLELTFAEVYDGPGLEGQAPPSSADLPPGPDPTWLAASAEPAPCLRLLRSSFPAAAYLSAVRSGEEPPVPTPAESFVAVSRRDYVVRLTPLSAAQHRLLERLRRGAPLDEAAAAAGVAPLEAWRQVRRWSDDRLFSSLRPGALPGRFSPDQRPHPTKEYA